MVAIYLGLPLLTSSSGLNVDLTSSHWWSTPCSRWGLPPSGRHRPTLGALTSLFSPLPPPKWRRYCLCDTFPRLGGEPAYANCSPFIPVAVNDHPCSGCPDFPPNYFQKVIRQLPSNLELQFTPMYIPRQP